MYDPTIVWKPAFVSQEKVSMASPKLPQSFHERFMRPASPDAFPEVSATTRTPVKAASGTFMSRSPVELLDLTPGMFAGRSRTAVRITDRSTKWIAEGISRALPAHEIPVQWVGEGRHGRIGRRLIESDLVQDDAGARLTADTRAGPRRLRVVDDRFA